MGWETRHALNSPTPRHPCKPSPTELCTTAARLLHAHAGCPPPAAHHFQVSLYRHPCPLSQLRLLPQVHPASNPSCLLPWHAVLLQTLLQERAPLHIAARVFQAVNLAYRDALALVEAAPADSPASLDDYPVVSPEVRGRRLAQKPAWNPLRQPCLPLSYSSSPAFLILPTSCPGRAPPAAHQSQQAHVQLPCASCCTLCAPQLALLPPAALHAKSRGCPAALHAKSWGCPAALQAMCTRVFGWLREEQVVDSLSLQVRAMHCNASTGDRGAVCFRWLHCHVLLLTSVCCACCDSCKRMALLGCEPTSPHRKTNPSFVSLHSRPL